MAFDLSWSVREAPGALAPTAVVRAAPRAEFRSLERLVVLLGASAFGAAAGFAAAMMAGRSDLWLLILVSTPFLIYALHLTARTLSEALADKAYDCVGATVIHGAALLAWPMTSLLSSAVVGIFWIAPLTALSALVLFASCWSGGARAVYRSGLQGALVAALAAHQSVSLFMGA